MDYVYIDESGSEGTGSRFLIFASVSVKEPRELEKAIKKLWEAKPQYHTKGEFHANSVDDATRKRILSKISELDVSVRHIVVDKRKQRNSFRGVYYFELAKFIDLHPGVHEVVVDKKDTSTVRSKAINRLNIGKSYKLVTFDESHKVKQLQAADFVAWSLGRMYEYGDPTFYEIIKHKESPLF